MKTISILSILGIFLCAPFFASAETVLRVSDSVSLGVDQVVEGDFYGVSTGGAVSLSGTIEGDALVVGTSVTANGFIDGDLQALAAAVQVHASITDDVRIVAGETTIAEPIHGDVFVVSGVLTVLSSADIKGNLFFYGGEAEINGIIEGSVYGKAESMRIDGRVAEHVDVGVARNLVLGDRADIGGDVRYESSRELTRAQNAVVVGDIVQNTPHAQPSDARDVLVPFLMYAFTVLIVFALFRNHLGSLLANGIEDFTKNGLIGIAGLVLLPVVVLLLFVTVIGLVVGVLGLLALLMLYIVSFVLVSVFLGMFVQKLVRKTQDVSLLWTLAGIVLTEILLLVPLVGPLILLVFMAVVAGSLLRSGFRNFVG